MSRKNLEFCPCKFFSSKKTVKILKTYGVEGKKGMGIMEKGQKKRGRLKLEFSNISVLCLKMQGWG